MGYYPEQICPICGKTYKRMRDHWRQSHSLEFKDFDDFMANILGVERPTCPYCGSDMYYNAHCLNNWSCKNKECRVENHGRRMTDTMKEGQKGWYKPGAAKAANSKGLDIIHHSERSEEIMSRVREHMKGKGLGDPEVHKKTVEASKRNGSGVHSPDFYKNHKSIIDASLAKGRETQRLNNLGIYSIKSKQKALVTRLSNRLSTSRSLYIFKLLINGKVYTKPGMSIDPNKRKRDYEAFGYKFLEGVYLEGNTYDIGVLEIKIHNKFSPYSDVIEPEKIGYLSNGYSEFKNKDAYPLILEYLKSEGYNVKKLQEVA